ncbi:MAG: hypothetical protein C4547_11790 [Phycisphaerales bacterium]|nr:MAG: hypothetical protein C4547_11790 [Phycisphaerales bacterium]
MRPLLLILLVLLAGVLVFRLTRTQPQTVTSEDDEGPLRVGPEHTTLTLGQRDLPGEEPPVPPEFDISFDVPQGVGGNRLVIYIRETHGYYVETFQLLIKKKDLSYTLGLFYDRYLKANDVLEIHENIVPAELPNFGGEMGAGDDWEGVVTSYGRARVENPDPLPEIVAQPTASP